MTAATKSVLLPEEDLELRRWFIAAAAVLAMHAGLVFWIMHTGDANPAGTPPAAIMIELPPMDMSAPKETPPEAIEGPKMTQAEPEEVETPRIEVIPELPPAQKPAVVLMTPPKVKPKPKKIVKEVPKPVVKRTHEPPEPRTSAPRHAEAERGPATASRQGTAGSAASISTWRAQIIAQILRHKPAESTETGTVTISFTLTRGGRLLGASLAGSSGSSSLDHKAMEMVHEANPFPAAPPDEMRGGPVAFSQPVRFHQR